jgi:hypothetical protein
MGAPPSVRLMLLLAETVRVLAVVPPMPVLALRVVLPPLPAFPPPPVVALRELGVSVLLPLPTGLPVVERVWRVVAAPPPEPLGLPVVQSVVPRLSMVVLAPVPGAVWLPLPPQAASAVQTDARSGATLHQPARVLVSWVMGRAQARDVPTL